MEHKFDASNKILGRLATEVAMILRGKHTAHFNPSSIGKDSVTVYNTDKIRTTGRKKTQKSYYRHSGFPGGIREEKLGDMLRRDSREAMKRAVMGMLPKNRLRAKMMKKLTLIKNAESAVK